MNVFITGIDGFIGSHVAEFMVLKDWNIWGFLKKDSYSKNIESIEQRLNIIEGDLLELDNLIDSLGSIKPDVIIHLAGLARKELAQSKPYLTYQTNVMGSLNILEAVRINNLNTKIIFIINGTIYGKIAPELLPVNEETPFNPVEPIAVSHASMDIIAQQYMRTYNMDIVLARTLNLLGPRQNLCYPLSDYAKQIAANILGYGNGTIKVGKLTAERDFLDVRDAARALYFLAKNDLSDRIFMICSGQSYSIRSLLNKMIQYSNLELRTEVDPKRIYNVNTPKVIGDPSRLGALGFESEISIEDSVIDMLNYWLKIIEFKEFIN